MSGITTDTVLMIHSDDPTESSVFVDSGQGTNCPHTITPITNPRHETDQAKFGASSIFTDNSVGSNIVITGVNDDFHFSGDFTIDFWKWAIGGTNVMVKGDYITGNTYDWRVYFTQFIWNSNALSVSIGTSNTTGFSHYLITRYGDNIYTFKDGVFVATAVCTGITNSGFPDINIGRSGTGYITQYLDEIRIQNGSSAIFDPSDSLFIPSGIPADGFTPPTMIYTVGIFYGLPLNINPQLHVNKPYYFIKGDTQEDGMSVYPRKVLLIERQSGQIVRETNSADTTGIFEFQYLEKSGLYTVVGLNDDPATPDYNDCCYGPLTAKAMTKY